MNKYLNPRSKRKQKAKAKREAREMCEAFTQYPGEALNGAYAQTPDEFLRAEKYEAPLRPEPDGLPSFKKLKPSKIGASGKEKDSQSGHEPCNRNASKMNEHYRYG